MPPEYENPPRSEPRATARRPGERGAPPRGSLWLVLAVVLHGLVYFVLLPPWMGEDEPWHFEYARDLALAHDSHDSHDSLDLAGPPAGVAAEEALTRSQQRIRARTGAAPEDVVDTQARIVASMQANLFWERVDFAGWGHGAHTLDRFVKGHSEADQPPLYYAACAAGLRLFGLRAVEAQLWFLRGLSFLCYLAVVWLTWALARLAAEEAWIAACAALVVAWLPMHAHQAAIVNNDVLVKVFASAALWLAGLLLLGRAGLRAAGAMLACAALAVATKPTAIGVVPPLCVALAAAWGKDRSRAARVVAAGGAAALLAGGAILYWQLAGTQSLPDLLAKRHWGFVLSRHFYLETLRTLAGSFNWYTRDAPRSLYALFALALGGGLVGSVVAAVRGRDGTQRRIVALCWLAVGCQFAAMLFRGFATGRYLFPVLPALGTLVAVGWIAPWPADWRPRGAVLLALALVLYDGFVLWNGLVPNLYLELGS